MMVDPAMIIEYAVPIIVITLAVILGQAFFGTMGVMLAGQPLKTAMQCGFSLTQIGEFAFIIASLGLSLHVTSDFLYPIVVAVSVITTFLTPYMIRVAEPASNFVDRKLPETFPDAIYYRYADCQSRKFVAEAIVCLSTYSGGVFHCQYFGNYPFVPFCSTFATRTFAGYLGPIGRSCFYYLVHIPFFAGHYGEEESLGRIYNFVE